MMLLLCAVALTLLHLQVGLKFIQLGRHAAAMHGPLTPGGKELDFAIAKAVFGLSAELQLLGDEEIAATVKFVFPACKGDPPALIRTIMDYGQKIGKRNLDAVGNVLSRERLVLRSALQDRRSTIYCLVIREGVAPLPLLTSEIGFVFL